MTLKLEIAGLILLAVSLAACSKAAPPEKAEQPKTSSQVAATTNPVTEAATPGPAPAPATVSRGVKTEMRNVMFHLTDKAPAHVETLSGELWPTGKNDMPMFDDKTSYEVRVTNARVSITPQALASILNTHVFAKSDAPIKDISISIDKDRMLIKGKLHSKGDIPFETTGTLSVTSDGRIRVKTEKVKAMHVSVKGLMDKLGIELANVVNTSKIDGIDSDKNDLLMDLRTLLPPPHINGKVAAVKLENNAIITIFGDGGATAPRVSEAGSYMAFQGNSVRFGKLVMESTDIIVLDMDSGDPLDWNQDHYREQLVAGYSKITPSFGLRAYVKDYAKLPRAPTSPPSPVPTTAPSTPAQN